MIEALGAIVSNNQLVRSVAEQTSSSQSFAANPSRVQVAAASAPYFSPHVELNGGMSKPIFIVRDSATGDFVRQFPTEGQIRAYQRAMDMRNQAIAESVSMAPGGRGTSAEDSAIIAKSSVEFRQARQQIKHQEAQSLPGTKSSAGSDHAFRSAGDGQAVAQPRVTSVDTSA
ncbi:MAG: hypothetical protein KBF91_01490 [Alphaproteobacteria bacterium]|jgi:hypothetical protein|nr:hypothetical protein [Alphaproteobacteria bacterium]